ncbi:MAG TPA: hypothetical protein DDY43_07210 [Synechococcales bacterium UBA10510]|nr:hypothetical protein [Synechococcales bacterium UBA10510]
MLPVLAAQPTSFVSLAPGTRTMAPGLWQQDNGTRTMAAGQWQQDNGIQIQSLKNFLFFIGFAS